MKLYSDSASEFNSGGKPRVVQGRDGWQVVGKGRLARVGSPAELPLDTVSLPAIMVFGTVLGRCEVFGAHLSRAA